MNEHKHNSPKSLEMLICLVKKAAINNTDTGMII